MKTIFASCLCVLGGTALAKTPDNCVSDGRADAAYVEFERRAEEAANTDGGESRTLVLDIQSVWRDLWAGEYGTADYGARNLAGRLKRLSSDGNPYHAAAATKWKKDADTVLARVAALFPDWQSEPPGSMEENRNLRWQKRQGVPQVLAALERFPKECGVKARFVDWSGYELAVSKKPAPSVAKKKIATIKRPGDGQTITVFCSGNITVKDKGGGSVESHARTDGQIDKISTCMSACRNEKKTPACIWSGGSGDTTTDRGYACTQSCVKACY